MSASSTQPPASFPRAPLIGAGALIAFSITVALVGSLGGSPSEIPNSTPVVTRDLRFEDRADGSVAVYDADGRALIDVAVGQNGFLRGTLRGLARARHLDGVGQDLPFRLTGWADGRLTLDDPTTGRHIELEAFGPTNEQVFADFLPPRRPAP